MGHELVRHWVRDNALTAGAIAHPHTYILMPWVSEFPSLWTANMPFYQSQLKAARKIFGLGGKIWIEKMHEVRDGSIQSIVKDRVVHCNMGIASENFSMIKTHFNPIGERQILHMSNLADYKGFDITCASLQGLDTLLHVATNSIQTEPGLVEFQIGNSSYVFNYIGYVNNNDVEFNQWVTDNCDFYIHTGRMDAQATTILESCARGLVPLVTPESGFSSPHAIHLTHDPNENRQIINKALNLSETELLQRSQGVREQVRREHNWQTIFNTIWQEIQLDLVERSYSLTNSSIAAS
ncbi:MAG: glycosyltransferase [Leptolyngbyaceae cyanobacterium SL_7_1]|nr:glycosyltransferase [Leptolyngbyaceae cyanobacterium SL_7_1]